jgi:Protein of unknown function (DUF4058)
MVSPFPGMDPYLEQPTFWSAFHSRLIVAMADALAPQLLPQYYIEVETRTYVEGDEDLLVGIPDGVVYRAKSPSSPVQPTGITATQVRPQKVTLPIGQEVKERYLEVREVGTDAVITVIEVLSPKNKRAGQGRSDDERKRETVLGTQSHWVEIDLLRAGQPMPMHGVAGDLDYRILVSRSDLRPVADLYGFTLREAIPPFLLPLKGVKEAVEVDLQTIVAGVYARAGYGLRLNYQQTVPPPPLSPENQRWFAERLAHGHP